MSTLWEELFETSVSSQENNWTHDALAGLAACKGLLLFADAEDRPVQLLQSANMRRTAAARLLSEQTDGPADRKALFAQTVRRVHAVCCYNDLRMHLQSLRAAHALWGENIEHAVQIPQTWFAAIQRQSFLPYFYVSGKPTARDSGRVVFGLFPSRKAAQEFCDALNNSFCLCRNPILLSSNKVSCPYYQMHKCPAPCMGNIPRQRYLNWADNAITAAGEGIERLVDVLAQTMRDAAAAMRFEQAHELKQNIERLHKLAGQCRWLKRIDLLRIIHIDRGPKIRPEGKKQKEQQFELWLITHNRICNAGAFLLSDPPQLADLLSRCDAPPPQSCLRLKPQEHFGLLSLLIFRSRPQGLWLDASGQIPQAETVRAKIEDAFAGKPSEEEQTNHDPEPLDSSP